MNTSCKNVYKLARNIAGLTREVAAEKLHISTRTLAYYECEKDKPNTIRPGGDIVEEMIRVYETKWLAYMHFKTSTELGRKHLPDIDLHSDVARLVLKLKKEVDDMNRVDRDMISIACDGRIDKHEEDTWKSVIKEVREVAEASLSLIFTEYKKSPSERELQKA